ncbi:MAG: polysaccharide biosynthesis protein [Bacteroidota bacterium]
MRQFLPALDLLLMFGSYSLAFLLRFDGAIHVQHQTQFWQFFLLVPALRVLCNFAWGIYRQAWRYVGMREVKTYALSYATGSACFALALYFTSNATFPRSIVGIEFLLSLVLVLSFRYALRYSHEIEVSSGPFTATLIVGAGDAGEMLARDMLRHPENGLKPVAFVDDDLRKRKTRIHGIEVVGDRQLIPRLVEELLIDQIVLAMPSVARQTQREILELCAQTPAQVRIIPGLHEIINGTVSVSHLREVEIEDLLGREPVVIDDSRMHDFLDGKVILVSGAGGSIGSELCRQILHYRPSKLVLLGHGENSIHDVRLEFERLGVCPIVPVIADIRDRRRIETVFRAHRPQRVFHAAAHKHVPLMEENPVEAASNNVLGTRILAEAAEQWEAESFVLISTDKAVHPTSLMGMSKRLAELSILDLARGENKKKTKKTKFTAVRFGNVLGSRGSVVPLFREQIARGGPLTVTHPEMTRYFMTIPEAASLVLQSGSLGRQGEVFLLEMGEPVKILDLARNMIRLSGFSEEEIGIRFTGIRPGEKLFEELRTDGEGVRKTEHPQIFAVQSAIPFSSDEWQEVLHRVSEGVAAQDEERIRALLNELNQHDQEKVLHD